MDPVSAVANAVGTIFNVVGHGRRTEFSDQPGWIRPDDFQRQDYTPAILIGGGVLVLVVIIIAIMRTKK
jgi:hypothetical protein